MGDRSEIGKVAAVVSLFVLMLFFAYLWPFHLGLDDVRNIAPEPIKGEIDRAVDRLPADQRNNLDLPLPEVKRTADTYLGGVVSRGEMDAMPWILDHTGNSDKFVADIFGAELIMGMTTRVSTEGGDWANAPDPITLMADTNEIFRTNDSAKASRLAKAHNATLIFLPDRDMYTGWWTPTSDVSYDKFKDAAYFREVYRNDNVTIYKVL